MANSKFHTAAAKVLNRRPDMAAALKAAGVGVDQLERRAKGFPELTEAARGPAGVPAASLLAGPIEAAIESIIEEIGRPTLFVTRDDYELPADEELARRLRGARALISSRLQSVGRVEVFDGTVKWPVGTAWMVADNIVITNRHVAEKFATTDASGKPILLTDLRGRPYKVVVDFREEHGSIEESEAAVEAVVYLPRRSHDISDIALLRLAPSPTLPPPIPVLGGKIDVGSWIAVVGYPQPDDRIPPEAREVEENYFSHIYGVKRLSPGQIDALQVAGVPAWLLAHDATTLGGNSGSVLLDLATGSAAGIHFKGEFKKANYAVHSDEILRVLAGLQIRSVQVTPAPKPPVEAAILSGAEEEAAEDLRSFRGYDRDFIDPDGDAMFEIPLPTVTTQAPGSVAQLEEGGTELRYRNFSVMMNRNRRLCFFSAVNIDGERTFSIRGARPRWRTDRRLAEEIQIIAECYGLETEGKFSRGHMTRREDPNWGDDREEAIISNRHTFFVTNACPQMQPFNAGIWLSLEDFALENCDRDDMRISVFTGPIFRDNDPDFFGVKVPVEFWKIIAFKHDTSRKLSATGYMMSQRDVLPTDEEFVFGQFKNSQVTIRHIERLTGLLFHHLHDHDPFDDGTETVAVRPLRTLSDIVFV